MNREQLVTMAYAALDGLLRHAQIKRRAAELVLDAVLERALCAERDLPAVARSPRGGG